MKRMICYLAALVLLLLPTGSFAECEHYPGEVSAGELLLKGYIEPQPGIPGYSGDWCCPICGAVVIRGNPIDPLPDPDEEEKKGNEQEDPVPVPFAVGVETPETLAEPAVPELSSQPTGSKTEPDIESGGGSTFSVPNVIPVKGMENFIGEWHYFRIVNGDGSEMSREEMLAEGLIYDYAEIIITKDEIQLFAPSLDDSASVEVEFDPEDGSLKILNGSEELPVLRLADNGMLILFVPAYNTSSGDTTAYLTREEP